MCRGCADEYFGDRERPPLTPEMSELAERMAQADQDCSLTYGGLHIVVDDFNAQAEHIEWCAMCATDECLDSALVERVGEGGRYVGAR